MPTAARSKSRSRYQLALLRVRSMAQLAALTQSYAASAFGIRASKLCWGLSDDLAGSAEQDSLLGSAHAISQWQSVPSGTRSAVSLCTPSAKGWAVFLIEHGPEREETPAWRHFVRELRACTPRLLSSPRLRHRALERRVAQRTEQLASEVRDRARSETLQRALFRIAELSGAPLSLAEFYAAIHGIVGELLYAKNFFIALLDEAGTALRFPYCVDEQDDKYPTRPLRNGLTEYVLRQQKPLLCNPAQTGSLVATGEVESIGTPSCCWLGVPLVRGARSLGALVVQSYTEGIGYTHSDQELLTFVSLHVAGALERKHAQDSLREANVELSETLVQVDARTADILNLGEIGKELTATLDTEQAFERVHRQASSRLDTYVFSIGIYDQANALIRAEYFVEGGQRQASSCFSMDEQDRPAVWCVRERRELITANSDGLLNFVTTNLPAKFGEDTESIVYLPLIVEQQVIGCLSVQSLHKHAYSRDQLEFLRVLASYTAIAISNSRAHGELATAHKELALAHVHMQQTQQKLLLQEKMASLGTLTAGVAHEINNPTNFVHVAAQNLRVDIAEFQQFTADLVDADEAPEVLQAFALRFAKLSGHVKTMLNGTERIKSIVKDLRAFTRTDQSEKTTARMSECLLSTLNLVRSSWHDKIEFISEFIDDPEIACWPALLNQVFMNLLVNSTQSIAEKQKLDSTLGGRISIRMQINADQLQIDFSDNGIGMSPALQARILEPFFTTKSVGEGTGLGLSISYGIILQHGGELRIHSTPGEGSCFSVRLPSASGDFSGQTP